METALLNTYQDKISIVGQPYPLGDEKEMLINIIMYTQYGSIFVLIFLDSIISQRISLWKQYITPNRMRVGVIVFIGFNFIIQTLSSTGAFEVHINGKLIHSKLATGQMPTYQQIMSHITQ